MKWILELARREVELLRDFPANILVQQTPCDINVNTIKEFIGDFEGGIPTSDSGKKDSSFCAQLTIWMSQMDDCWWALSWRARLWNTYLIIKSFWRMQLRSMKKRLSTICWTVCRIRLRNQARIQGFVEKKDLLLAFKKMSLTGKICERTSGKHLLQAPRLKWKIL